MLQTPENESIMLVDLDLEPRPERPPKARARNGTVTVPKLVTPVEYAFPPSAALEESKAPQETRPVLAVFCFEPPDSAVGHFVTRLAGALAQRSIAVHVFSRTDFELDSAGVGCHAMGECDADDLVASAQEFGSRACNAFLKLFPVGSGPVTLMALEWSTLPAVQLLRGLKKLDLLLSLHSVERQRSDLTSELSIQIDEIERSGLREAKAVLLHDPVTAHAVNAVVPECAERIVPVYEMFPSELFQAELDPGAIKARYQVGPIDPMILFVGDLSEQYGADLLVKALPPILKNHPQARLVVVGEGDLYWPLRVYTRYLLLEHAVRLVGSVVGQPLFELVKAADVVVVPSRSSTPWWPIQAAWAARRPVVVSHQAAPGLLEHERDAVLVYPSENSCVWGIERVLFDAGLRQTLADNGAAKLDAQFAWGSVAAKVEAFLGATANS
jgi:glycosyltransferase involved in cell wall biosynthesis